MARAVSRYVISQFAMDLRWKKVWPVGMVLIKYLVGVGIDPSFFLNLWYFNTNFIEGHSIHQDF